jgi:hypothetical protein
MYSGFSTIIIFIEFSGNAFLYNEKTEVPEIFKKCFYLDFLI